jgi:hypothetical protein
LYKYVSSVSMVTYIFLFPNVSINRLESQTITENNKSSLETGRDV